MSNTDFMNIVARRKLGAPDEWEWCRAAWKDDGVHLEGGVPDGYWKSGFRRGLKKWSGELDKCIVSSMELKAEREAYVKSTGNCCECMGDGKVEIGYNEAEGQTFRPCAECKGTGRTDNDEGVKQ